MADQHIVSQTDRTPEIRVMASAELPRIFLTADTNALSVAFHMTRPQVAQLIAALQDADNELGAREALAVAR